MLVPHAMHVPYAMHAVRWEVERIVVLFADTDVFILLRHYWGIYHREGLRELWIRAGVKDSTRYSPVHILAPRIGKELCYLLPLVHTFIGCDYTSKVETKHTALNAIPCKYLKDFDSGPNYSDDFMASCEAYKGASASMKCHIFNNGSVEELYLSSQ